MGSFWKRGQKHNAPGVQESIADPLAGARLAGAGFLLSTNVVFFQQVSETSEHINRRLGRRRETLVLKSPSPTYWAELKLTHLRKGNRGKGEVRRGDLVKRTAESNPHIFCQGVDEVPKTGTYYTSLPTLYKRAPKTSMNQGKRNASSLYPVRNFEALLKKETDSNPTPKKKSSSYTIEFGIILLFSSCFCLIRLNYAAIGKCEKGSSRSARGNKKH